MIFQYVFQGSFSSVQDAVCLIIEQMEYFKSGGRILKSGKRKIEEKKEEVKVIVKNIIIIIIEVDQIQNLILENRDHVLEVIQEKEDHIHIIIEEKGIIEKAILIKKHNNI